MNARGNLRSSEVDRLLLCSDDSDVEDISDPEWNNDDSDSPALFGDDTDDDPDDVPQNIIPGPERVISSDEESDRENRPIPVRGRGRPRNRPGYNIRLRGRRRDVGARTRPIDDDHSHRSNDSENNDGDDDDDEWVEVDDGVDDCFLPQGPEHTFDYQELPGPKHCPPSDSKPVAYFNLFFTASILELISRETNRFAQQYMTANEMNLSMHNKFRSWKATTANEIRAFIIVMLNMGLVKKPTIKSYWTTTLSQSTNWFGKMFSRNRFESIYSFLHLVNNESLPKLNEPGYDPTAKFNPLLNHANNISRHHYTPYQHLSVDESLVGTKNHTQLLQYLPNKHHHKWGVKLWMLCDSVTNYCLGFTCYRGARDENKEEIKRLGLGYVVVTKLLEMGNYFKKGFHVVCDNFFTSVSLAQHLFSNQTFFTGTIHKTRKYLPPKIKERFSVGQKSYFRRNELLLLGYREKRSQKGPVCLLSTKSKAVDVDKQKSLGHNRFRTITKPHIIRQYNDYMGGIDSSDMMLYTYADERRSVKFWKKVVSNIIGRMVLNSYILYRLNCTGRPLTRYQYMVSIIEDVTEDWLRSLSGTPLEAPGPSSAGCGGGGDGQRMLGSGIFKLPGTKERCCAVCSKKSLQQGGKMKKSRTACNNCQKGLHGACYPYHIC